MKHTKQIIYFFLIFLLTQFEAFSKITPTNNQELTQTSIMFEIDEIENCLNYEIEIYSNNFNELSKDNTPIKKYVTSSLAILISDIFEFGKNYKWRYFGFDKFGKKFSSIYNSFRILSCKRINRNYYKTNVITNKTNSNSIILLDFPAMAINKKGIPIWFLPTNEDSLYELIFRDINIKRNSSITYLYRYGAKEIDLYNNLLWEINNKDSNSNTNIETFHHEFEKLFDETYLICGSYFNENEARMNTLLQYNKQRKKIWEWRESESLKSDSVFIKNHQKFSASHLNGVGVSTKNKDLLFLSFKNLSNVLILNKKTGKFIYELQKENSTSIFTQQHGPFITKKDELLIYNNNIININEKDVCVVTNPTAMHFSPFIKKKKMSLLWTYTITSDSFPLGIKGKEGYCMYTKDNTYLITCGGANYSLEVNKEKEKVWECFFYKRKDSNTAWQPYTNYRCHSYSSLYPYYYTVQSKFSENSNQIKINNDGTDDDEYEVILKAKKNILLKTIKIKAGNSAIVPINFSKKNKILIIKPKAVEGIVKEVAL